MMTFATLFFLLCAFILGFTAGRIFPFFKPQDEEEKPSADYFQGLNYLLQEQTDEAMEHFLKAWQLNSDCIEVHVALGQLFCRRGEVDKAIHTHQQLLARSNVSNEQAAQVMLELARDYTSAGLLDRAETLLTDISRGRTVHKWPALQALVLVYEKEKEWHKAIDAGEKLIHRDTSDIAKRLAYYCCELAVVSIERADLKQARADINRAFSYDRGCVRASLLLGDIAQQQHQPREAIKALQRVQMQDVRFVSETFGLLKHCFSELGNIKGYSHWLLKCHQQRPTVASMLSMAELLAEHDSSEAACQFLHKQLQRWPSLQGLALLLDLHIAMMQKKHEANFLSPFPALVKALLLKESAYQCVACGFSGQKLYWQCPSCGCWGETVPQV